MCVCGDPGVAQKIIAVFALPHTPWARSVIVKVGDESDRTAAGSMRVRHYDL